MCIKLEIKQGQLYFVCPILSFCTDFVSLVLVSWFITTCHFHMLFIYFELLLKPVH